MKRFLPLLSLLALPHLVVAQPAPPAPPAEEQAQPAQPDFQQMARMAAGMAFAFNQDNSAAVAAMGAFYNSVQKANTYNGHWVMTQTTVKDGKPAGTNVMDLDSVWQKDPQTGVFKNRINMAYTATDEQGKTTTNKYIAMSDGQKSYRYYSDRNVWMEEPQTEKTAFNHANMGSYLPWATTLLRVVIGSNLKVQKSPDGASVISSEDGAYGATFNADGTLQSWRAGKPGKTMSEVHFDRFELNTPLPANSFVWQVPQGAQQVPPEEPNNKFEFKLDF